MFIFNYIQVGPGVNSQKKTTLIICLLKFIVLCYENQYTWESFSPPVSSTECQCYSTQMFQKNIIYLKSKRIKHLSQRLIKNCFRREAYTIIGLREEDDSNVKASSIHEMSGSSFTSVSMIG